jgi:serine/threonine-protein kinase
MQVLDALGHAHRAGVVHRDLKPANLMITEAGTVKVMDFGIARVLGSEHFTHGGYMMGTPAYMAPEQVLGREIDGRADLYSVGVVLYRLLSSQLPFKAETAISMVQKQISDAPTPIATFRPDLPEWCTAVIDRALAKSPSDRFQSAEEFRSALLRAVTPQALGELPTLSTPTPTGIVFEPDLTVPHGTPVPPLTSPLTSTPASTPTAIAPTPAMPAVSVPTPIATAPTPMAGTERTTTVVLGRTHLAAMAALFVILAAGIVMLAFAALRRGSDQPPTTTVASQSVPSVPSQSATPPAPAPVPPPAATQPPASPPPASSAPVTPTTPATKPLPPAAGGVATVGAVPAPVKPKTTKPVVPADVTTPPADSAGASGGRAAGANAPSSAPATPTAPSAAPTIEQPVNFDQVRVLVTDGGRPREQLGSLRLGDGRVSVLTAGGGSVVSFPSLR